MEALEGGKGHEKSGAPEINGLRKMRPWLVASKGAARLRRGAGFRYTPSNDAAASPVCVRRSGEREVAKPVAVRMPSRLYLCSEKLKSSSARVCTRVS